MVIQFLTNDNKLNELLCIFSFSYFFNLRLALPKSLTLWQRNTNAAPNAASNTTPKILPTKWWTRIMSPFWWAFIECCQRCFYIVLCCHLYLIFVWKDDFASHDNHQPVFSQSSRLQIDTWQRSTKILSHLLRSSQTESVPSPITLRVSFMSLLVF